eukprot:jgi/Mesvir1/24399/Mv11067-RA.1
MEKGKKRENSAPKRPSKQKHLKPPPFTLLKHNVFVHRSRSVLSTDDIPICECKGVDEDDRCGENCYNSAVNVECHPKHCRVGAACQNQRFQRRQYAKYKLVTTDGRGWGMVADADIEPGTFIIEYCGEVISDDEAARRVEDYEERGITDHYILTLSGSEVIDAYAKGSDARFINHSCDPNCETQKWTVNGEVCVGIFATKRIPKGTEFTYDYKFEYFGGPKTRCRCGATKCSGFLGANSKGFQEDAFLWEDDDDRFDVQNIPTYSDDSDNKEGPAEASEDRDHSPPKQEADSKPGGKPVHPRAMSRPASLGTVAGRIDGAGVGGAAAGPLGESLCTRLIKSEKRKKRAEGGLSEQEGGAGASNDVSARIKAGLGAAGDPTVPGVSGEATKKPLVEGKGIEKQKKGKVKRAKVAPAAAAAAAAVAAAAAASSVPLSPSPAMVSPPSPPPAVSKGPADAFRFSLDELAFWAFASPKMAALETPAAAVVAEPQLRQEWQQLSPEDKQEFEEKVRVLSKGLTGLSAKMNKLKAKVKVKRSQGVDPPQPRQVAAASPLVGRKPATLSQPRKSAPFAMRKSAPPMTRYLDGVDKSLGAWLAAETAQRTEQWDECIQEMGFVVDPETGVVSVKDEAALISKLVKYKLR